LFSNNGAFFISIGRTVDVGQQFLKFPADNAALLPNKVAVSETFLNLLQLLVRLELLGFLKRKSVSRQGFFREVESVKFFALLNNFGRNNLQTFLITIDVKVEDFVV
jgi:hypothetical protein